MPEQWIWMKHENMPDADAVRTPLSSLVSLHSKNGWFEVNKGGVPATSLKKPKPKIKTKKATQESPDSSPST